MKTWIGTSGFQYPEWKGKFYPEKMSPAKMLAFYAAEFRSTEVNYTFRSLPSAKTKAKALRRYMAETSTSSPMRVPVPWNANEPRPIAMAASPGDDAAVPNNLL